MSASFQSLARASVALAWIATTAEAFRYYATPDEISTSVPLECRVALSRDISCQVDDLLTPTDVLYGLTIVGRHAAAYCAPTCSSSLRAYQKAVASACGHMPYEVLPFMHEGQSIQDVVDGLAWAQKLLCLQDGSEYCLPAVYTYKATECSACRLKYGAVMQESPLGRAIYPEANFLSNLASCSVPPSSYPYTFTPGAPRPAATPMPGSKIPDQEMPGADLPRLVDTNPRQHEAQADL